MASTRIGYDPTTLLGRKVQSLLSSAVEFRKGLVEVNNEILAFDTDDAGVTAATGVSAGNLTAFKGFVNFAQAEAMGLTLGAIGSGQKTNIKQLIDAMA